MAFLPIVKGLVAAPIPMLTTFTVQIIDSYNISPMVKHFVLSYPESDWNYIPGQFITVHFEKDGKAMKRSYSLANAPGTSRQLEFAAGYVEAGPGTEYLFALKPGDKITISGPYGRLVLPQNTPKRFFFVATSTGVTPYRAMLPTLDTLFKQQPGLTVFILMGVRQAEDLIYEAEFRAFCANHPNAHFISCLSRGQNTSTKEDVFSGYVQAKLENLEPNSATDMVFLCGNPGMIDACFELLKNRGFESAQVIREKYISR